MLHSHAKGEALRLEERAVPGKGAEQRHGAVPGGKNRPLRRNLLVTRRDPRAPAVADEQVRHLRMKPDLDTPGDEIPSCGDHHVVEVVTADVRVGEPLDLRRRTVLDVPRRDVLPLPGDLSRPARELSVGEGARPALAKGVVGVRDEGTPRFERGQRTLALVHRRALLEKRDVPPRPVENVRGKEARRT
jgi:hypothetical protein